jgi:hypothetical protein
MNLCVGALPAEIAVEAAEPRRRLVAPPIVLQTFTRQIERPLPLPDAVLQRPADAAIGAARCVRLETLIGKAILHLEAHGAAERVEAEGRIVGPDVGTADRDSRDHVPVDGVAEGLVDADAVHVDREPLRRALQRRGHETAIAQILEQTVALDVCRDDARDALRERFEHAGRIGAMKSSALSL